MKKVKTVVIILAVISLPMLSSLAFAAQYTFIPRLDVNSYYTDNVYLTPTDTESAFVTIGRPRIHSRCFRANRWNRCHI